MTIAPAIQTDTASPAVDISIDEMLDTLVITRIAHREIGGVWVSGTIANHTFQALLFPDHATKSAFELDDSRISKLWIRRDRDKAEVASFDRGWDRLPTDRSAEEITGLLAAGLAEHIFDFCL